MDSQEPGRRRPPLGDVHLPVMVNEVLDVLSPSPGERFLDLTVGAGGHAVEIAARLGPQGLLVGIDLDASILDSARQRLASEGLSPSRLFQASYTESPAILAECGIPRVNGILADLGVSSLQLGDPGRGFSFSADGPLDMRMSAGSPGPSAADIVNRAPAHELERIFREYGEERFARRIAARIVEARRVEKILRTSQLAEIVRRAYGRYIERRIHPATRVFQALRIAVNDELENLKALLALAPDLLEDGGRIAVIAFHSLEDRLVKDDFRNRSRSGVYELITRKPLRPTEGEVQSNPRSRSARLRAARRSHR